MKLVEGHTVEKAPANLIGDNGVTGLRTVTYLEDLNSCSEQLTKLMHPLIKSPQIEDLEQS